MLYNIFKHLQLILGNLKPSGTLGIIHVLINKQKLRMLEASFVPTKTETVLSCILVFGQSCSRTCSSIFENIVGYLSWGTSSILEGSSIPPYRLRSCARKKFIKHTRSQRRVEPVLLAYISTSAFFCRVPDIVESWICRKLILNSAANHSSKEEFCWNAPQWVHFSVHFQVIYGSCSLRYILGGPLALHPACKWRLELLYCSQSSIEVEVAEQTRSRLSFRSFTQWAFKFIRASRICIKKHCTHATYTLLSKYQVFLQLIHAITLVQLKIAFFSKCFLIPTINWNNFESFILC